MRRRGVLVTSSKKRHRSAVKEEKDDLEDRLASQREWEELEKLTNASRARKVALEGLQTNRYTQAYDDVVSSDDEARENDTPNKVKEDRGKSRGTSEDRHGGRHQDSNLRESKGDDLDFFLEKKTAKDDAKKTSNDDDLDFFLEKKPEKNSDRKTAKDDDDRPKLDDAADVSEAKRRRLCNAPKDAVTDGDNNPDKPKKVRGGQKETKKMNKRKKKKDKQEADKTKETAEESKKTLRRKRHEDDKNSDRFQILEVEGYKKPRKLDTTRLIKYVDFDAPPDDLYGGDFRSQILRSSI